MVYIVTENPPPGKTGQSFKQVIDDSNFDGLVETIILDNRLVEIPLTIGVTQVVPIETNNINVNSVVINNTVTNNIDSAVVTAKYDHSIDILGITTSTTLVNDGLGVETFDNNTSPVWNTSTNKLIAQSINEVYQLQLRFKSDTDTLGGAFEIEVNKGGVDPIIDQQEHTINKLDQTFTSTFNLIVDNDFLNNGASIIVSPELGMSLDIKELEFVIIKFSS